MKKEVSIIWSETWLKQDIAGVSKILDEAVELVGENEIIINIESKQDSSGLSRFWIYSIINN